MVSTRQPFACTASIRQPRTMSPLTRSVHAPHTPCSQPMCEPVRPSSSRRKSTRCWRGGTLRVTCVPFTVRVITRAWSMRARAGPWRGAAWWPASCRGRAVRRGKGFLASSSDLGLSRTGVAADAEESDALLGAALDAGEADDGVVALAPRELEEHATCRRLGKLGADQDLVGLEVGLEQRLEETRTPARAARPSCRRRSAPRRARARRPAARRSDRRAPGCRRACRGCGSRDARCAPPPRRPAAGASRISARFLDLVCVQSAPMRTTPSARFDTRRGPSRPVMSTSSSGEDRRMLSAGIRLWPPASTFAPGRSRSSNASASERGFA